jgi:hypothetical protein
MWATSEFQTERFGLTRMECHMPCLRILSEFRCDSVLSRSLRHAFVSQLANANLSEEQRMELRLPPATFTSSILTSSLSSYKGGRASANHRDAVVKGTNDNWMALLAGNTNELPARFFLCWYDSFAILKSQFFQDLFYGLIG